ncbi:MAG: DegT/DnrJ/EryC1/StrS family aminotransferase [Bacteroidaceae bacterium]|nr:DegT/DnrJ/EryC1/StrS family aminotransferase [Bacteroidaceae bacterium]
MIKFLDLQAVNAAYAAEIEEAVLRVARSGWYLRGAETERFEAAYAQYVGTKYAVACGNGLDALRLIFRAYMEMGLLHEGDEVIVPANTYIASILSVTYNGLKPVFVEPDSGTLQIDDALIEQAITPRTRAILLVHLYGRCSYTERVGELCQKYDLLLVEDNAQAHGCAFQWPDEASDEAGENNCPLSIVPCQLKKTGSLGHAAGHSFYPGKNLGALGDAGCVTTDDAELAAIVRALGNYGSQQKYVFRYTGYNSRMDELHAAVLLAKLPHLEAENRHRVSIAEMYYSGIDNPLVKLPTRMPEACNVNHIFPVFCEERDRLQQHLREWGVETLIHYPIPPHHQECYKEYAELSLPITERIHNTELSLPIGPTITEAETMRVIEAINAFE